MKLSPKTARQIKNNINAFRSVLDCDFKGFTVPMDWKSITQDILKNTGCNNGEIQRYRSYFWAFVGEPVHDCIYYSTGLPEHSDPLWYGLACYFEYCEKRPAFRPVQKLRVY